jgi:hypothetical protein
MSPPGERKKQALRNAASKTFAALATGVLASGAINLVAGFSAVQTAPITSGSIVTKRIRSPRSRAPSPRRWLRGGPLEGTQRQMFGQPAAAAGEPSSGRALPPSSISACPQNPRPTGRYVLGCRWCTLWTTHSRRSHGPRWPRSLCMSVIDRRLRVHPPSRLEVRTRRQRSVQPSTSSSATAARARTPAYSSATVVTDSRTRTVAETVCSSATAARAASPSTATAAEKAATQACSATTAARAATAGCYSATAGAAGSAVQRPLPMALPSPDEAATAAIKG